MTTVQTPWWTDPVYRNHKDFASYIEHAAARYGDRTYVNPWESELGDLSFVDVWRFTRSLDAYLCERGVSPGAPCAVLAHNSTALLLLFLGTVGAGRIFLPLNPNSTAEEINFILKDCPPRVLFFDAAFADKVNRLTIDCLRQPMASSAALISQVMAVEPRPLDRFVRPNPDNVAEILYTSGSTGQPKGVLLSHANLLTNVLGVGETFRFGPDDRFLTVCPLFHNSGQMITTLIALACGGVTTAIRSDMGFLNFWRFVDQFEPNWTVALPPHLCFLVDRDEQPQKRSLRGIVSGGAPLPKDAHYRFEQRFDAKIYQGYGLTESASIATGNGPHDPDHVLGNSGRPICVNEIRIIVDDHPVRDGKIGEIVIKGDNVCQGYLNRPELTAAKLREGWLYTGDLGFFDRDGRLHVVDRVDNMVIIGGENVYPAEVEQYIPQLPGITDAVICTLPDAVMGQSLLLVYEAADGAEPNEREWKMILFDKVANFKVPRTFVDVRELGWDKLPRSPNGKLRRHEIQSRVNDRFEVPPSDKQTNVPTKVEREIAAIMAKVLDIDASTIDENFHIDRCAAWDSMAHLQLVVALERSLGISFPPDDITDMISFSQIAQAVTRAQRA